MFPLQRGNELVIQFSNSPHRQQQQHRIFQDMILEDYASLDVRDKKFGTSSQPKTTPFYHGADIHDNHCSNEQKKKKVVHRETERQRRQEMATLYAALRSLLPLNFIKGKRSISDHMNEAVKYIKHLQKNIRELGAKRDELKKLSNSLLENHERKHLFASFTVNENDGIVGIEITSAFREELGVPPSELLQLLLEEGLEVVNCLSTRVNGRLLHSLQCEVNRSSNVDLSELRRKIANVIRSFRCSD